MTIIKVRCGLTWLPEHRRDKGKPPILCVYNETIINGVKAPYMITPGILLHDRPKKITDDLMAEKLDLFNDGYIGDFDVRKLCIELNETERQYEGVRQHWERMKQDLSFDGNIYTSVWFWCQRCNSFLMATEKKVENFLFTLFRKHPAGTTINTVDLLKGVIKQQNSGKYLLPDRIQNSDKRLFGENQNLTDFIPLNLLAALFFHEGMTRGVTDRLFSPEQGTYLTNLIKNDPDCNRQVKAFINGLEPGEGGLEFLKTFQ